MIETLRRIESPTPPMCDYCREPAAWIDTTRSWLTVYCCEPCKEWVAEVARDLCQRRQSMQEANGDD